MPPKPDDFHVTGEVLVPNPGVIGLLRRIDAPDEQDGVIDLEMILLQRPGNWTQQEVWLDLRYDKVLPTSSFSTARIFCNRTEIASVPVENVH